jgi:hypothetical protein
VHGIVTLSKKCLLNPGKHKITETIKNSSIDNIVKQVSCVSNEMQLYAAESELSLYIAKESCQSFPTVKSDVMSHYFTWLTAIYCNVQTCSDSADGGVSSEIVIIFHCLFSPTLDSSKTFRTLREYQFCT